MVAAGIRKIQPGHEYEKYFDLHLLQNKRRTLLTDGEAEDTVKEITKIVKATVQQTKKLSLILKKPTLPETTRAIWEFFYKHYQYSKDRAGIEELRNPIRSWKERVLGIDCDDYTTSVSSVLTALGINHSVRITKYDGKPYWQHVYVVVPHAGSYLPIDPVIDKPNFEVQFSEKKDFPMEIQYLSGLSGLGNLNNTNSDRIIGDQDTLPAFGMEFSGLGGFGQEFNGLGAAPDGTEKEEVDAEQLAHEFLMGLKANLINTLVLVKKNPVIVSDNYDPAKLISRIELLLANFDNADKRNQILNELEKIEMLEGGVAGFNGLGGFFSNVKKGVKAVGQNIKKASKNVGAAAKKVGKAVVKGAKAVGKAIIRFNPLSVAIRNGFLLAQKINFLRQAERLGYGYLSDKQAVALGFSLNKFAEYKKKLDKVIKLFKGLQGKEDILRKNILKGWEHGCKKHKLPYIPAKDVGGDNVSSIKAKDIVSSQPPVAPGAKLAANQAAPAKKGIIAKIVSKTATKKTLKGLNGLGDLGEVVTAATIAAASGAIATVATVIKGTTPGKDIKGAMPLDQNYDSQDSTAANGENNLSLLTSAASSVMSAFAPADLQVEDSQDTGTTQAAPVKTIIQRINTIVPGVTQNVLQPVTIAADESSDTPQAPASNNNMMLILGAAGIGAILLMNKGKSKGLSGLGNTGKKKTSRAKKTKSSPRRKVKVMTM